jgi:hypothetical protein
MLSLEPYFAHMCLIGDLSRAKFIYETHPDIDVNMKDMEPLHNACKRGHLDVCEWLFQFFPIHNWYDVQDKIYEYLETACKYGHVNICKWLYSYDDHFCYQDMLSSAITNDHIEVCKWIYEINKISYCSSHLLDVCEKGSSELCKYIHTILIDDGIINFNIYERAFQFACLRNSFEICEWLLLISPNLAIETWIYDLEPTDLEPTNDDDLFKFHMIEYMCRSNTLVNMKRLYETYPNLFHNGGKLIYTACEYGQYEICLWLIEMNISNASDLTFNIVNSVSYHVSIPICEWIYKTNVNSLVTDNFSLIFSYAYLNGHLKVCKWLYSLREELNIDIFSIITEDVLTEVWNLNNILHSDTVELFMWLYKINNNNMNVFTTLNFQDHHCNLDLIKLLLIDADLSDLIYFDHILMIGINVQNLEVCQWICNWYNVKYKLIFTDIGEFYYEKYYPMKKVDSISICPICTDKPSTIMTPCSHQYCKSCISKWLKDHSSCPYCRHDIDDYYLFYLTIK